MLSDAEETLTDTDKAGAIGSSTDPNAASLPVTEHKNDPQPGEGMDEDSNASTIVTDKAEEDAYDGACWKVVRTKRRSRNAAALEAASPLTSDLENPLTKPRPSCKSCGGEHATTDPQCPRRQRQPFNRSWVKKAIDEEQRQMTVSTAAAPLSATTDASVTPLKKSGRSRSKKRSASRSKARTKSKSRSRSRSQSTSARIQEKRPTIPASQASPSPYKKALLGKPATSTAATDHQQPQASENNNAKAAPREVSWGQGPAQLNLPQTSPHNTSRPSPPPNAHSDPFPEITQLRRDMEARYAQVHAQLDAAMEHTNARIQAAIDSARQESLALRQEIIAVIQASEERTHALFTELVSRLDSVAPLPNSQSVRPQPPITGARRTHPYSRPSTSSHDDDGVP
ncbi:hypothetical protein MTO96_048656 [Rhipicephalus appendiculatus]